MANGHIRGPGARNLVTITSPGETVLYLNDGKGGFTRNATAIPVFSGG